MIATQSRTAPVAVGRAMVAAWPSLSERDAIMAGVRAADAALVRFERDDVLQLFVSTGWPPSSEPKLEALRAYAELRRALIPQDQIVPATSLLSVGFTTKQIAQFDKAITSAPPTETMMD